MRARYVWVFLAAILLAAAFFFDTAVVQWVKQNQTPGLLAFMEAVSHWGDWPSHALAGAVGLGIAWAQRNRPWRAIFFAMLVAVTLGSAANRVIKITAGRSRPAVALEAGWTGWGWSSKYQSFPSGHTASSTAFFSALFFARRRLGVWLLPIPAIIGFSRVYVGAHYPSDVIFAAMVGAFCALYTWRFIEKRTAQRTGAQSL